MIINTKVKAKKVFSYTMMGTMKDSGTINKDMEKGNIFGSLVNRKVMSMKVAGNTAKELDTQQSLLLNSNMKETG